jgi:hypothetical protein
MLHRRQFLLGSKAIVKPAGLTFPREHSMYGVAAAVSLASSVYGMLSKSDV